MGPGLPASSLLVGIDDTDTPTTEGTNQLARRLVADLPGEYDLVTIARHQLFLDPRVPYTSKNGSASILLARRGGADWRRELLPLLRETMLGWCPAGSDPGLCVAEDVPAEVRDFGRRCQRALVCQSEARELAGERGLHLEGLGGTEDGVIGALAAVGLAASGEDGRIVHMTGWSWPDPFAGPQPLAALREKGVRRVIDRSTGDPVREGAVDVGKHLRPSLRGGEAVLFVEPVAEPAGGQAPWRALKLP